MMETMLYSLRILIINSAISLKLLHRGGRRFIIQNDFRGEESVCVPKQLFFAFRLRVPKASCLSRRAAPTLASDRSTNYASRAFYLQTEFGVWRKRGHCAYARRIIQCSSETDNPFFECLDELCIVAGKYIFSPLHLFLPESGFNQLTIHLAKTDFPIPDFPIIPKFSPRWSFKSIPLEALYQEKIYTNFLRRSLLPFLCAYFTKY